MLLAQLCLSTFVLTLAFIVQFGKPQGERNQAIFKKEGRWPNHAFRLPCCVQAAGGLCRTEVPKRMRSSSRPRILRRHRPPSIIKRLDWFAFLSPPQIRATESLRRTQIPPRMRPTTPQTIQIEQPPAFGGRKQVSRLKRLARGAVFRFVWTDGAWNFWKRSNANKVGSFEKDKHVGCSPEVPEWLREESSWCGHEGFSYKLKSFSQFILK